MQKLLNLVLGLTLIIGTLFSLVNFENIPAANAQTPEINTVTRPSIIPDNTSAKPLFPHSTESDQNNYLINQLLPSITATIISLAGGLALVFTIINGIMMITSAGDPEKFGKARTGLIWGLAGLLIAGLSYGIVAIIASFSLT